MDSIDSKNRSDFSVAIAEEKRAEILSTWSQQSEPNGSSKVRTETAKIEHDAKTGEALQPRATRSVTTGDITTIEHTGPTSFDNYQVKKDSKTGDVLVTMADGTLELSHRLTQDFKDHADRDIYYWNTNHTEAFHQQSNYEANSFSRRYSDGKVVAREPSDNGAVEYYYDGTNRTYERIFTSKDNWISIHPDSLTIQHVQTGDGYLEFYNPAGGPPSIVHQKLSADAGESAADVSLLAKLYAEQPEAERIKLDDPADSLEINLSNTVQISLSEEETSALGRGSRLSYAYGAQDGRKAFIAKYFPIGERILDNFQDVGELTDTLEHETTHKLEGRLGDPEESDSFLECFNGELAAVPRERKRAVAHLLGKDGPKEFMSICNAMLHRAYTTGTDIDYIARRTAETGETANSSDTIEEIIRRFFPQSLKKVEQILAQSNNDAHEPEWNYRPNIP